MEITQLFFHTFCNLICLLTSNIQSWFNILWTMCVWQHWKSSHSIFGTTCTMGGIFPANEVALAPHLLFVNITLLCTTHLKESLFINWPRWPSQFWNDVLNDIHNICEICITMLCGIILIWIWCVQPVPQSGNCHIRKSLNCCQFCTHSWPTCCCHIILK